MVWIAVGTSLATTLMLLLSTFLTYHDICGICTAFSILLFALFAVIIPESPTWLYHEGRIGDAEWSQSKLGIAQPILDKNSRLNHPIEPLEDFQWSTVTKNLNKITRRDVYIPLIVMSTFAILYGFSGGASAVTYMVNIIDDSIPGTQQSIDMNAMKNQTSTVHFSESTKYSLICGIAMCIGSLLTSFVLPCLGLRASFVFSHIGSVVGLLALTFSNVIIQSTETALTIRISAVTLLSFLVSITLGPTMAASGDIFPVDAKGFASIPDVVGNLASGVSIKMFPYLYYILAGYTYLVFAAISVISAVYAYFLLPEVVGKTLKQINEEFG